MECSVDGCATHVMASGMCSKHYNRMRRKGSTDDVRKNAKQSCSVDGCDRLTVVQGLCGLHRDRLIRSPERIAARAAARAGKVCDQCGGPIVGRNAKAMYCSIECKGKARVASGQAAIDALKSYYKRKYGLRIEDVAAMLEAQGGACAICGTTEPGGKHNAFAVDHCHASTKVRALLCQTCNLGLGLFRDDPDRLDAAAAYLRRFAST